MSVLSAVTSTGISTPTILGSTPEATVSASEPGMPEALSPLEKHRAAQSAILKQRSTLNTSYLNAQHKYQKEIRRLEEQEQAIERQLYQLSQEEERHRQDLLEIERADYASIFEWQKKEEALKGNRQRKLEEMVERTGIFNRELAAICQTIELFTKSEAELVALQHKSAFLEARYQEQTQPIVREYACLRQQILCLEAIPSDPGVPEDQALIELRQKLTEQENRIKQLAKECEEGYRPLDIAREAIRDRLQSLGQKSTWQAKKLALEEEQIAYNQKHRISIETWDSQIFSIQREREEFECTLQQNKRERQERFTKLQKDFYKQKESWVTKIEQNSDDKLQLWLQYSSIVDPLDRCLKKLDEQLRILELQYIRSLNVSTHHA